MTRGKSTKRPKPPPTDVDGLLKRADKERAAASKQRQTALGYGWGDGWGSGWRTSGRQEPAETEPPKPPPVMPGHRANTMSARERKARRATELAARKRPRHKSSPK